MHRPVEHLSRGELGLQDRDIIAVAGFAVCGSEGMGKQPQPFAQQGVDLGSRKVIADGLQTLRIGAAQDAVVERLKGDAFARELALGIFVAVQAELGIERKVAAELEEEWPEVAVDGVDVVAVHHRARAHDPRIGATGRRAQAPLGAEHRGLLLRLADEHHSFLTRKPTQVFGHHIVLALALAKLDERNSLLCRKVFERRHEAPAHRAHQRCRGQRLATMVTEEPDNPLFVLQPRHKHVEVHPVDPLDGQLYMTADDLSHTLCYHPLGSGRAGIAFEALRPFIGLETGSTRARHEPAIGATFIHTPRWSEAKPR